jgi:DNA repair protein SbcD/Mre11
MMKVLHFADAHIDMAAHGKRDPQSGLPYRVLDFLSALDTIIDTAVNEKVDLVLFAGDAYKDRIPVPTYQREWGKRIIRLSQAGIPTLLLVGNHDLSPVQGRAHALQEFRTLQVPHVRVIDRPVFLHTGEFENLPVQIMGLPWVSRSSLILDEEENPDYQENKIDQINTSIQANIIQLVETWLKRANPAVPTIFLGHASVEGAVYGNERTIMLGSDYTLPASLLKDPRLDYVALGHIHKKQDLNPNCHPPIVYPGSIERVDFGEVKDEKCFVIASIEKGHTIIDWRPLHGRKFIDCEITLDADEVMPQIMRALPSIEEAQDAIIRVRILYPKHLEPMIEENSIHQQLSGAFSLQLIRRPRMELRGRLGSDFEIQNLSHLELLDKYWDNRNVHDETERSLLKELAMKAMSANNVQDKELS